MTDRTFVRQIAGPDAIDAAIREGEPVRLVLYRQGSDDPAVKRLVARAQDAGLRVRVFEPRGPALRFAAGWGEFDSIT